MTPSEQGYKIKSGVSAETTFIGLLCCNRHTEIQKNGMHPGLDDKKNRASPRIQFPSGSHVTTAALRFKKGMYLGPDCEIKWDFLADSICIRIACYNSATQLQKIGCIWYWIA